MNYSTGDFLIYKNFDVCRVEAVETPTFEKNTDRLYYKLKSVFSNNNETTYVPIDSNVHMREPVSKSAAEKFMQKYCYLSPDICNSKNNTTLAEHYDAIYSQGTLDAFIIIIKEIFIKDREAKDNGRKLRQIDTRYLELTLKPVSEEFALSMNKTPDELVEYFKANI